MPRICWQTIFICGKPQRHDKSLKQLGLLSRQADIRRVTGASSVNLRQAVERGGGGANLDGMLAEYAVFNEEAVVLLPNHLSFEEAATFATVDAEARQLG
jgi:threonine dehydrogenase-like Zn-dependent dehydrogenase